MRISYFPGCTLKTTAKNFETSAIAVADKLGIEFVELSRWNCCGTVYSLTSDDLMHQLAPIRDLVRVEEDKFDRVVALCSMCYNTLKRANLMVQRDKEKLDKINDFMYKEDINYDGKVEVVHFLEILRDEVGWDAIKESVKKPLKGMKFVPYYGCLLLRPPEAAIDDVENPEVMSDLLSALGAEIIDFPYETECCGAYQSIGNPDIVINRTKEIIGIAKEMGADGLVLSCPLCDYNLDAKQKDVIMKYPGFHTLPVYYFTQLMAIAFGLPVDVMGFKYHYVDPEKPFKEKGIL